MQPRHPGLALAVTLAGALLGPGIGRAEPVASSIDPKANPPASTPDATLTAPVPTPTPAREPAARDVAGAPAPGEESGRLDPADGGDSAARWIGRGILFLPRVAAEAAFAPVRAGIWANERYQVHQRLLDLFFNEARTMGLYPTLGLQSGFGVTAGARFVHNDLLGAREHLSLSAAAGGRFRESFEAKLRTGNRFGRLHLELEGEYDRRPKENFFGIGDAGELAIETRYRQQLQRARAVVDVRLVSFLHLRGAGALTDLQVGRSDVGAPIDEIYQTDTLTGWTGARHAYAELELRWDSRRAVTTWEAQPLHAAGLFAGAYAGPVHRLDGGIDFWRYGVDLQQFLRVGPGPRVLAGRAHVEAVTGSRAEVPFFDLPQLGGSTLLRGYPVERFRDRIAAVGSLDYQWDLSQLFSADLFVDAGRVYASSDELALSGLRIGYGLGLEAHTRRQFGFSGSIASSIDGGVFVNLSFAPVFEVNGRVEKH